MLRDRVSKKCEICPSQFEVIRSREHTAKYCSRKCYDIAQRNKTPWNKGRRWEEMYGEERAIDLRKLISRYTDGENNPMFGKHHSDNSKQIMSAKKDGYVPWNTGKKFPGMFSHINRLGENNAYIKFILKEQKITYNEYLSRLGEKEQYYRAVMNITRLQNISILENYEKRAKAPNDTAHHLDHVYPIIRGYENGIPPEIIGDISNLQFIHWRDNLKKADKLLDKTRKELYESSLFD